VLRTLGSDVLADGGQAYWGRAYHDALDVARAKRIPIVNPRAGDVWRTDDGLTFRFHGPSEPMIAGTRNDINNNSVVFILEYRCPECKRAFKMLFTGTPVQKRSAAYDDEAATLHSPARDMR